MLPLDEIELAEQHFLEQRLPERAVGFLQYLPFDQPQPGVGQVGSTRRSAAS